MRNTERLTVLIAALLLTTCASSLAWAQGDGGQGRAVVTIVGKHNEVAPTIAQTDVSAKANGKEVAVTGWRPFKGGDDALELVVLIDGNARNLGRQFDEIGQFVTELGPNTKMSIGYMENGRAMLAGPLSADRKQVIKELHLPAGPPGSPYFSLSDLANNWPSHDRHARREVVILTDGIDLFNPRFDPDDPYVQTAVRDVVRAGLVIYSIYWRSFRAGAGSPVVNGGQSLINEVTSATGGNNYWEGTDNPISFEPFFKDILHRLENQYELDFTARLNKKPEAQQFKLKVEGLNLQVAAPQQVWVDRGAQ